MRVLIADDHPLLIDGLCSLLEAHGIEVMETVNDGQAAVSEALRLEPDLVLMDIRMPVLDGLAATRLLKVQRPHMKVLILTTSAEDEDLFEAIKSGACGYLLKTTRGPDFIEALQGLEQGVPPFSPGLAERLMREFARISASDEERAQQEENVKREPVHLTDRQMQVLRLVATGLTYKEVGSQLALAEVTVRYHMSEIMKLLHLENRTQLIAYVSQNRIIDFQA